MARDLAGGVMERLWRLMAYAGLESAERYVKRKTEQHTRRIRVSNAQDRLERCGRRLARAGA